MVIYEGLVEKFDLVFEGPYLSSRMLKTFASLKTQAHKLLPIYTQDIRIVSLARFQSTSSSASIHFLKSQFSRQSFYRQLYT
jgi:hypothetical protein